MLQHVADLLVLDDHYKWKKIAIAFNPQEEKFEVSNNAIRNSGKWIPDISPVLEPAFDTFSFGGIVKYPCYISLLHINVTYLRYTSLLHNKVILN